MYGSLLLAKSSFAARIEQTHLQAGKALGAIQNGYLEDIRIGAGPLFHLRYHAGAFEQLREDFPRTRIHVIADLNDRNIARIRDGSLDISFGTTEYLGAKDEIKFTPLTDVEQGILVSATHPLVDRRLVKPHDLTELDWIVYSDTPGNEDLTLSYFAAHCLPPPNIILQTTSLSLGLQMVANSSRAMTLPTQLAPIVDQSKVRAVQTDPPIASKLAGAFYRRSSLAFPAVSRLIEITRAQISDA